MHSAYVLIVLLHSSMIPGISPTPLGKGRTFVATRILLEPGSPNSFVCTLYNVYMPAQRGQYLFLFVCQGAEFALVLEYCKCT